MLRKFSLWLHKWLGLVTGLVIFIVSITGCIYVFYDELKIITYPDRFLIGEPSNPQATRKPLTELFAIADAALPEGEKINRVDIYAAKNRTWVFRAMKLDQNKILYSDQTVYHKRVYINPYSGRVQFVENSKNEFFQLMLQLHRTLLLGTAGQMIVAVSTVIFLLLCFSGLILWWPTKWKKKMVKKAVWVNYSVKWKRLVYDLHNVLGFQTLIFAVIIAFFGLTFSFPGLKKFSAELLNSKTEIKDNQDDERLKRTLRLQGGNILDQAVFTALRLHPNADQLSVRLREPDEDQDVQVRMEENKTGVFKKYAFNQQSGKLSDVKSSDNLKAGDYLMSQNFDLHTGSIGGLPTKILAFIVSLVCASLPVTGTIVWWNKRPKGRRPGP